MSRLDELHHDSVIEILQGDEAEALRLLPDSTELMAHTNTVVSREIYAIATASIPPDMREEYELVTMWRRELIGSAWIFVERWMRLDNTIEPLVRLDGYFRVVRGEQ